MGSPVGSDMPKVELEYRCKKCKKDYPATISYTGDIDDLELDENQSRCPFCGEWNCAEPASISEVVKEAIQEKGAKKKPKKTA
jgi:DNA-directed RNA polymerase subunit RPC12/RpoP